MTIRVNRIAALAAVLVLPLSAWAADATASLTLKDHKFSPAELTIPANTKVKLTVKNEDATAAEFESHDFKAEKVIPAGKSAIVKVGPLKAGKYKFVDEYHEATAKGVLIVK